MNTNERKLDLEGRRVRSQPKSQFVGQHITQDERYDWAQIGMAGLARAYADDEPEYTATDIKQ